MEEKLWDVVWYRQDDGVNPVQEFLLSLDERILARFLLSIDELAESSITEQGVAKYLERQLWEIWEDKGFCRVIFSYLPGQRVLLLHGFCHHSSPDTETPHHEIQIALERLESFSREEYSAFLGNVSST